MNPGEAKRIGLNLDLVSKLVKDFKNLKLATEISMQTRTKEIAGRLGVGVRILSDTAEINSLSSARKRRAKGWYDSKTDEVVIIAPNNRDIADILYCLYKNLRDGSDR